MEETTEQMAPAPQKKGGDMKKRLLTGIAYVTVLIGFFLLKVFVDKLFFDGLILIFTVLGTFEMLRAFKEKLHRSQMVVVLLFAALVLLTYVISDYVFHDIMGIGVPDPNADITKVQGRNYSLHFTFVVFMAGIAVLLALLVIQHENVSLESTGYALLSYLYPSFFLLVLSVCNHLEKYSELAILFVFVICPFADSLALVFGKAFGKKLPAKMAPHVSPKKTLIGGFGGLLGGAVGAVVIFFTCYGLTLLDARGLLSSPLGWSLSINALDLIFYIALGILTAAFSQFGDLVESAVKRKLGIKDMGKILPGHGGILDRIDSSLYAGLVVCLVIVARIMIVG